MSYDISVEGWEKLALPTPVKKAFMTTNLRLGFVNHKVIEKKKTHFRR